ncbi:MAG: hypothetical protein KVP17_002990 [Porospora cf. gigantea B]|nr:MAG: hypothetical protein KVP17_002990 [Porospora cf. gigantea B]
MTPSDSRPRCYLDILIDDVPAGRVVLELRSDVTPKTAENFRQLCTHQQGFGYQGCLFHRVVPGFVIQSGDFLCHNGTGSKSVYGASFPDENFRLKHKTAGVLSMANVGPNTNGSQFFITTAKCEWLDGHYVAFGNVVEGMHVVEAVDACGSPDGKTLKRITIIESGELLQRVTNMM